MNPFFCRLMSALAVVVASIMTSRVPAVQRVLQVGGMRFFRDLGRIKSKRRLSGGKKSLQLYTSMLFGNEEPDERGLANSSVVVEIDELKEAIGGEGRPLWLAISGRVYDVSEGSKFYGAGAPYHKFVGRDATRAFCTGCTEPECLIASVEGLGEKQVQEAQRWLEYYEFHDKYKLVGIVQDAHSSIDALVEMALETESIGDYKAPAVPEPDIGRTSNK